MIDFSELQPGTKLSSNIGAVIFQRYKENKNGQNVFVKKKYALDTTPGIWLKEKEVSLPTVLPKAKLDDNFLIQGHA